MRLNYFENYEQEERQKIKVIMGILYKAFKSEIDKQESEIDKIVYLSNIMIKDVHFPKFMKNDMETHRCIIAYTEWLIHHWDKVESHFHLQYLEQLLTEKGLQDYLKMRINNLEGRYIDTKKLPTKYATFYNSGRTPGKINIEKVTKKNYAGTNQYIKALEETIK